MKCEFKLNYPGDKVIDINVSFWSGSVNITSDELNIIRQSNLNEYKIQISKDSFGFLKIKRQLFGLDPIPKIVLDSVEFDLAQSLSWYEYLLCCIPLILISGGAIGGFIGLMGMRSNLWLIRINKYPTYIRIFMIFLIGCLSLLVYKELSRGLATAVRLIRS
ncbi:hypothetical protein [Desulfosporosinus hippei]|uniref:Uncharacterized protein n=1 Tax=Desulfosporosinus hippei DSM 8344 TaxID=1121419 RepID=A0A1G8K842_9FIRM|nr:hypothetical protein [Desulfosporosinus hippei]SDI39527.1 hypothetical protein SAMN05443529_13636 [Desulfosporosinus hippei DSM 8344]